MAFAGSADLPLGRLTALSRGSEVPPDNYSAIDRQLLRLQAIPARLEAERLIAKKFGMSLPSDDVEMTGIFAGEPNAAIQDEMLAQKANWERREATQREPEPHRSVWHRLLVLFSRRVQLAHSSERSPFAAPPNNQCRR